MSESEYGSPINKRRGCGNIKELMNSARLKREEFIPTESRLVEKQITGPECECIVINTEEILLIQCTIVDKKINNKHI